MKLRRQRHKTPARRDCVYWDCPNEGTTHIVLDKWLCTDHLPHAVEVQPGVGRLFRTLEEADRYRATARTA